MPVSRSNVTSIFNAELCPLEKAKSTANKINESGGRALAVPGDMLKDGYIDELVKKAAEFGNGKIHVCDTAS